MIIQPPFKVALTADFYDSLGKPKYDDIGLGLFAESTGIEITRFAQHAPEIAPEQLAGVNAAIVLTPRVTAHSLSHSHDLLAIGRFGVGYDSVDVAACTAADVLLYITAGAVDRPVAEATVAWMLALTHHVRTKDQLVRSGRWDDRSGYMGCELRDRTLGIVGMGGIGRALLKLLDAFGMRQPLVYDPFVSAEVVAEVGAKQVSLDELLTTADFVSLHCPLNDSTRNLIGARELALMQPTSYFINTARGGIVDETALYEVLVNRKIAGAALDCFSVEPVVEPTPLMQLDNVLLAPHSIAWTNELFRDIGRTACRGILDLHTGRLPHGIINREILDRPSFHAKWSRLCGLT